MPAKSTVAPVTNVKVACIDVVDPVARAVLAVPERHLLPTRGLDEYRAAPGTRDISLCCLFQKSRCRAQQQCRQVHADRAFVATLRAAHTQKPRCCAACADATPAVESVTLSGRATAGMPALPTTRIVPTYGCRSPATLRTLDWSSVCRLQLQDSCKYGDSCRNVHICAKLGKMLLARAACNVNAVVPDSVRDAAAALDAAVAADFAAPAPAQIDSTPVEAPAAARLGIAPVATVVPVVGTDAAVDETVGTEITSKRAPRQRMVPMALRAKYPSLDEASLTLRDGDLDGLVFNLPTLASASDAGTADRFDLFTPSPVRACAAVCSPSMCSPVLH